jgi:hypothetical protein
MIRTKFARSKLFAGFGSLKQTAFVISTFFISHLLFAQTNPVPKQYRSIKEVAGDLDKDGIAEKVIVYNMSDKADETNGVDRELIIYKKQKEKWIIWQRSVNAVGNSKDGGMMGDPFEDVEIKNGLLQIHQSGGSSWKWGHVDKYRFQNNRFELIGYTSNSGKPCEYWLDIDFNLMTGKVVVKKEYEKCEGDEIQAVYKKENETFTYKPNKPITLENRSKAELKITSPKYRHELYL